MNMKFKNKRLLIFLVLSIFLLSIFPPAVSAVGENKEVMDTVYDTLQPIVKFFSDIDLSKVGQKDDAGIKATFWVKFLILILLFVIVYYILQALQLPKNIAGTVAAVLTLISILAIPAQLLSDIAQNYALVFSLMLFAAPILGILWARWQFLGRFQGSRWIFLGVVILDIIILAMSLKFLGTWDAFTDFRILSWFVTFMIFLLIYDIVRMIQHGLGGRGAAAAATPAARGGTGGESRPGFFRRLFGGRPIDLDEAAERSTADAERLTEIQRRLEESQESAENLAAQMDAMDTSDAPAVNEIRRQLEILTQNVEHLTQMRDRLRRGR